MKKGWKSFWIACIILGGMGMMLCATGVLMGGSVELLSDSYARLYKKQVVKIDDGELDYDVSGEHGNSHGSDAVDDATLTAEELENAAGDVAGEYEDIRSLKADLSYINVILKEYEGTTVKVQTKEIDHRLVGDIRYRTDGDELEIELKNKKKWKKVFANNSGLMTISIPKGSLEKIDVSVGAGTLVVDGLCTKEMDVEIGAGEAVITNMTAENMGVICGAGEAQITGDISGKSKIECGIGTVIYQASGKESDYNYELNCGVGSLKAGGITFEGVIKGQKITNPGAERKIEVDCGVGDVSVMFME